MQQPYALRILGDKSTRGIENSGCFTVCLQVIEEYDGGKPDHDALCNTRIMFGSFTDLNIHRGCSSSPLYQ